MAVFPMTQVPRTRQEADAVNGYSQMPVTMPFRSRLALNQQVGSALTGGMRQQPTVDQGVWGPGGRSYPGDPAQLSAQNTPTPGAQAVQPRYSQTVQGAQQSYLDTMAQARANTQARVGQMLASGGQYQATPGSPATGRIGTMQSNIPGGMANDIIRLPNGGTLVQGAIPTAEWKGMASNLPGANGRTNGDMQAALQDRLSARRATQRAERIVARAPLYGLNARTTPAVRSAMMQLGMPIPGEPRRTGGGSAAAGPTGVAGHQQRIGTVVTSPLGQSIGLTASPNDIDLNFRRLLQSPPAASDQDRQAIVGMLESQMAMLPNGGTPQQRAQLEAYRQGGVPRLGLAIGSREGSPQYGRNQQYRPQIPFAGGRVGY